MLAAMVSLVFVGCGAADPAMAHGVSAVQFPDVVVPAGLRLRESGHESYSRDEAGWRQGHFVYTGQARPDEAVGYVKQRMPQHSWELVSEENLEDTSVVLRFRRSIYSANYSFLRIDGATRMVVDYSTDYTVR
jgi:hypothetical protein